MSDKARLEEIRKRIKQAPTDWRADFDGDIYTMKALPLMTSGSDETAMHEDYCTVHGDAYEVAQLLLNAPEDMRFLLNLVERSIVKVRELQSQLIAKDKDEKPKDYTTNAAMMAKDPTFKKFLKERHGLGNANDKNTHQKIREMCAVASVKELNSKPEKASIWLKLLGEFSEFQRTSSQHSGAR